MNIRRNCSKNGVAIAGTRTSCARPWRSWQDRQSWHRSNDGAYGIVRFATCNRAPCAALAWLTRTTSPPGDSDVPPPTRRSLAQPVCMRSREILAPSVFHWCFVTIGAGNRFFFPIPASVSPRSCFFGLFALTLGCTSEYEQTLFPDFAANVVAPSNFEASRAHVRSPKSTGGSINS